MDNNDLIKKAIQKVVAGSSLIEEEAGAVMDQIMSGKASPAQIAAFLVAIRLKGETVEEITGFARVMKNKATPIHTRHQMLVDTCGTGGDGVNTFNISTAAALVVAGCGVPVAKHGNRSVSSNCGSADVLEELGINLNLTPSETEACLDSVGIAFLFAPALHGAMKHAAGPRKEIGIRTVFNILGPLTNPAGADAQVLGVYNRDLVPKIASVLARLKTKHAFVVHGEGGTDEVTTLGPAYVSEVSAGTVYHYEIDPLKWEMQRSSLEELKGGSPAQNAAIILRVLSGEIGSRRDTVILNASLALIAAGQAGNMLKGIKMAGKSIDSGEALKKLKQLTAFTSSLQVKRKKAVVS